MGGWFEKRSMTVARPSRVRRVAGTLAWVLSLASPVLAQSVLRPSDQAYLSRLALARAHSHLVAAALEQPLDDDQTVQTWLTGQVALDRALRLALRDWPRFGAVRYYTDGVAEVDVLLEPRELADLLGKLQQAHPPASDRALSPRALAAASRRWTNRWCTGTADVNQRVPDSRKPQGWEDVTVEGAELARRAAVADARLALFERIAGLKLSNAQRLDAFLDSSPAVRAAVAAGLEEHAICDGSLEPDQVATATARIRLIQLIGILSDALRDHYEGAVFHAADFREMALHVQVDEISATGMATPPPRHRLPPPVREIEYDAPAWVDSVLRATGRYAPLPDLEPPSESEHIQAAWMDGIDALRQQVLELPLRGRAVVQTLLADYPELKPDVVTFLAGTRLASVAAPKSDGTREVRVELPARRLWVIVKRVMHRVEIDPPELEIAAPDSGDTANDGSEP